MQRGIFISLEGGEGCGKTTQAARLAAELEKLGKEVVCVREPGGTRLGELIRPLLKDETLDPPVARAELLLFLAARAQLVEKIILPALAAGKWVVSDRFSDSTFAYQGYARSLPLEAIAVANDFACSSLKPDLTLLLQASAETARKRAAARGAFDRFEREDASFHKRLADGFAAIAAAERARFAIIDANGSPEQVWEQIWKSMKPFL